MSEGIESKDPSFEDPSENTFDSSTGIEPEETGPPTNGRFFRDGTSRNKIGDQERYPYLR